MFQRRQLIAALSTLVLLAGCSGEPAEPAATAAAPAAPPAPVLATLPDVVAAHGMDGLSSISLNGTAWRVRNSFRQTRTANPPWPERDEITNYVRTIDLGTTASRATGETFASNLFLDPPVAGVYQQNVTPETAAWVQQLEYWITPWGFLRGAQANNATTAAATVDGEQLTAISWSPAAPVSPGGPQYTVTGYVGSDNLLQRIETRVEDAFMGDMLVANVYSGYADMGGKMVPATIEQERGGGGIFGVNVTGATINPANAAELLTVPPPTAPTGPPPGGAPPAAPTEVSQELAPGIHLVVGSYQALVMDFGDFVAVFEAGQPEATGQKILDETKRLFPGKEIRYVINSHPHADHTGGLIPFVREGVTIITHQNNVEFLNMALSTPRTLLGQETLSPKFENITTWPHTIEGGGRTLVLHSVPTLHTDGMLVAVVPDLLMFEADFTLPQPGAMANPFVIDLANYVDQNNVQFDKYIAVHANAINQTRADLMATIGK
jgi:glyoxylase-like metal-dependent hydrolase (beta-lactamase superfamily II)